MNARRLKSPTITSLVFEVLFARTAIGEFTSQGQLRDLIPTANANQISAALHDLRKYEAVDVVIEPDGTGWWFTNPSHMDRRSRVVLERTPESQPRRRRRKEDKQ